MKKCPLNKGFGGAAYLRKLYAGIKKNDIKNTMVFKKEEVPKPEIPIISTLTSELKTSNIVLITQSDYTQTPYITTNPRVSVVDKLNCIKACKYYQEDLSKLSLFLTTGRVTDLELDIRRMCDI